jgi:hypothetical protein
VKHSDRTQGDSSAAPPNEVTRKELTRHLLYWRRLMVESSHLDKITTLVLHTLAHDYDAEDGRGYCYPSTRRIARNARLDKDTVTRHLKKAVAAGWIQVAWHRPKGRGRAALPSGVPNWGATVTGYLLTIPPQGVPAEGTPQEKGVPFGRQKGVPTEGCRGVPAVGTNHFIESLPKQSPGRSPSPPSFASRTQASSSKRGTDDDENHFAREFEASGPVRETGRQTPR